MSPPLPPENDEDEKNPIVHPDSLPRPENPKPAAPGEKADWEKELTKKPGEQKGKKKK